MRKNHTQLVVILDRSGSMDHLISSTIEGYNKLIADQKNLEGTADVMLVQFDDKYEVIYDRDLRDVPTLTREVYFSRGMTALNDAIGTTFNSIGAKLASLLEHERPEHVIVSIFTDGLENASRKYTHNQIADMVKHQQEKYNWKVNYYGANQNAEKVGATYNIPIMRAFTYTADAQNMTNTMSYNSSLYKMDRGGITPTAASVNMMKSALVSDKVASEEDLKAFEDLSVLTSSNT